MAKFGPGLFQFFANTVKDEQDGSLSSFTDQEYQNFGFVPGSEKVMETFKNNLFRLVMLRARNHLIAKMKMGITNPNHAIVDIRLTLADEAIKHVNEIKLDENGKIDYRALFGSILEIYIIRNQIWPEIFDDIGEPAAKIETREFSRPMTCGSQSNAIECSLHQDLKSFRDGQITCPNDIL